MPDEELLDCLIIGGGAACIVTSIALAQDRYDLLIGESALTHRLLAGEGAIFPETNGPKNRLRSLRYRDRSTATKRVRHRLVPIIAS